MDLRGYGELDCKSSYPFLITLFIVLFVLYNTENTILS